MTDLNIVPSTGGLTPWQGHRGPSDADAAFADDIFLINHHVAGTTHVPDPATLTEDLDLAMTLTCVREKNGHDSFAVRFDTPAGRKVGYLPQGQNQIIARLLDAGLAVFAKVTEYEMRGNWPYIRVDLFLRH